MKKGKLVFIKRRRNKRIQKRAGGASLLARITGGAVSILLLSIVVALFSGVGAVVGVWAY